MSISCSSGAGDVSGHQRTLLIVIQSPCLSTCSSETREGDASDLQQHMLRVKDQCFALTKDAAVGGPGDPGDGGAAQEAAVAGQLQQALPRPQRPQQHVP